MIKFNELINEELENLSVHEKGLVYKFIRTKLVANIPGIKTPGAKVPESVIETIEKQYPLTLERETDCRETWPNRWKAIKEALKRRR